MRNRLTPRGFTIVELLIVIVIIAILAAITIVAYTGIQGRARDAQRLQDASAIVKALEIYKSQNGEYPAHQTASGWEESNSYPTNFINALVTSNVVSRVPIDPKNSPPAVYAYYRYGAGYGCDASRGAFYVLVIRRGDTGAKSPSSPGFKCPDRDWASEGWYVTGGYTS